MSVNTNCDQTGSFFDQKITWFQNASKDRKNIHISRIFLFLQEIFILIINNRKKNENNKCCKIFFKKKPAELHICFYVPSYT